MEITLKELYKKEIMTIPENEVMLTLKSKMTVNDAKLANKVNHWVKF